MTIGRAEQIAAISAALAPLASVLAGWEAGSAAFGADDAYSDVDLAFVVEPGTQAAAFAAAEAALAALAPIRLRYQTPEPAWHGFSQRFYLLAGASPYHMVDLSLQPTDVRDPFLDPGRHGLPRVLFDKAGVVRPQPGDPAALATRLAARLPVLVEWFRLSQPIVVKEALRGRAVDALSFYHGLTLRPLVEALRIRHCPVRHDFGLRYLAKDLPADVHARVERLAFVADLADLTAKQAEAAAWLEALAAEGAAPGAVAPGP